MCGGAGYLRGGTDFLILVKEEDRTSISKVSQFSLLFKDKTLTSKGK